MIDDDSTTDLNTTFPIYCGRSDSNESLAWWMEGLGLLVVGLIAMIGNILTFIVFLKFTTSGNKNIYNSLVMQLMFMSCIKIFIMLLEFSLRKTFKLIHRNSWYGLLWPKLIYPCLKIASTWVVALTVAITRER